MENIKITLETLYDILRNEKKKEDLQKLEPSFFADVISYLREKKSLLDLKCDGEELFAAGEKEKVDQMKQAYVKGQVSDIEVKEYLYESLIRFFAPARKRYEELKNNPELVKEILGKGAEKAKRVAGETMKEVRETIGLVNAYSVGPTKKSTITIDDFSSVEIRVGKVEQAEHVEKSEKLIRLHVDFGSFGKRIIFTGVRNYGYIANDFIEKQFLFVVNLEPRKMLGEESQGMILAVDSADGKPLFISGENLPIGSSIR